MKKRLLSIFVIAALLFSFTSVTADTGLQGSGTQASPFIANDETTLRMLADFPDAYWKLSNDIELTSAWEPISEFSGTLDGNGYKVSGISISDVKGSFLNEAAFFKVNKGTIKDLMLNGAVDYSSSHLGGAIFVYENYGTVSGCSVSGTAELFLSNKYSQNGSQFGGFVSLNYSGGVIENCYSRITIKGLYGGGSLNNLAGSMGFIAANKEGGVIRSCYTASSKASGQMSQTIKAAFCDSNSGSIEACFYDKDLCGYIDEYDTHGLPKSTAAMKMPQTYTGWDFNSVWAIDESINDGYPYLQAEKSATVHTTGVTLDKTAVTIAEGDTVALYPIFTPSNTSNKNVAWTTSSRYVATVDENGVVAGVSEGTAVITATSEDGGYTAACTVTVTANSPVFTQTPASTQEPANYPYKINELIIKSESGEILDKAPANSGFIINTKFTKIKERDAEDYVFIAVYDTDGALLNVDYIQSNLIENHTYSVGFYVPKQEKAIGSVKAFVWSGFNSTEPLAGAELLSVSEF
ncbi:MAG: Ig-like domain-containing protein [bacterium]|nr:Ig-like domain-containing protein [bacterium]